MLVGQNWTFLEPENKHSDVSIIVKKGKTTIGHIPEGLCPLTQLFSDGSVVEIKLVINCLRR